tara:strand:+ start:104 stop:577 length:474 start_codon:yes stop_codon:yes gene_type:complete
MYQLAICDLYHPLKYGYTTASSRNITGQFLVYTLLDVYEFFDERGIAESHEDNLWYLQCNFGELSHPFIRNYSHYILSKKYNNTEIVETQELPGGELVAVLKTFWISIIQRRWRRIFNERKHVLNIRTMPTSILYRETHGKWPPYCSRWPVFTLNIA